VDGRQVDLEELWTLFRIVFTDARMYTYHVHETSAGVAMH